MAEQRVTWTMADRRIAPDGRGVSGLGLHVTYPGRATDISIALSQPLRGQTPENEAALDELLHLRDALNNILGGQ